MFDSNKYNIKIIDNPEYLLILFLHPLTNLVIAKIDLVKDNPYELYIASIYVAPDYLRTGLSKELFDHLFTIIESPEYMMVERIVLDVIPINECDIEWLVPYYQKIGFVTINKYPNYSQIPHMEYFINSGENSK